MNKIYLLLLTCLLMPCSTLLADDALQAERLKAAQAVIDIDGSNWQGIMSYYTDDVIYEDAIMRIEGKEDLTKFYRNFFSFTDGPIKTVREALTADTYFCQWEADYIIQDKPILLKGISILTFEEGGDRVVRQQDVINMGDIYERIPLLGRLVRQVNKVHVKKITKDIENVKLKFDAS